MNSGRLYLASPVSPREMRVLVGAVMLLAMLYQWGLLFVHLSAPHYMPWNVAGWFIDYSHGFVRRGLSGEMFLRFFGFLGVSPARYGIYFLYGIYVFLGVLCVLLAFRKRQSTAVYLILLSPLFFSPQLYR